MKDGAIMMALRRYDPPMNTQDTVRLKNVFKNLGDITVRSNLSDFTFQNSKTLINSHSKVLEKIHTKHQIFYAFTRGIFESNIMSSTSEKESIFSTSLKMKLSLACKIIYPPLALTYQKGILK